MSDIYSTRSIFTGQWSIADAGSGFVPSLFYRISYNQLSLCSMDSEWSIILDSLFCCDPIHLHHGFNKWNFFMKSRLNWCIFDGLLSIISSFLIWIHPLTNDYHLQRNNLLEWFVPLDLILIWISHHIMTDIRCVWFNHQKTILFWFGRWFPRVGWLGDGFMFLPHSIHQHLMTPLTMTAPSPDTYSDLRLHPLTGGWVFNSQDPIKLGWLSNPGLAYLKLTISWIRRVLLSGTSGQGWFGLQVDLRQCSNSTQFCDFVPKHLMARHQILKLLRSDLYLSPKELDARVSFTSSRMFLVLNLSMPMRPFFPLYGLAR